MSSKTASYDQTIQIICNLSDINSQRAETRSVPTLLGQNVGGFRFHLYWDHEHSQLLFRRPDGQMNDFRPVIEEIGDYLDKQPDKILTLFLDLDLPVDTLHKVFKEKDLLKYEVLKKKELKKYLNADW
mgnify:CR=1 FL=1